MALHALRRAALASVVCNGKVTQRVQARFGLNVLFTGTNLEQHVAVYVKFDLFFSLLKPSSRILI